MNEAIVSAIVDIIEQLLGHDSPQPEVIAALERVLAGRREKAGIVESGWRCFHCGEMFVNTDAAREHFGDDLDASPLCQIDAKQIRELEHELARYRAEDSDSDRQFYAMSADHARALIREEQKGYDKGLADGRADTRETGLREAAEIVRDPTEAMLIAARDWSKAKYGTPIGNDAAAGCWQAMFDAVIPSPPLLQSGERGFDYQLDDMTMVCIHCGVRVVGTHRKNGPMGELMREPGGKAEVEAVALALAAARGYKFRTKETTVEDLDRVFGQAIFCNARAAIAALDALRAQEKPDV